MLDRDLARLGYGSRAEVRRLIQRGRVTDSSGARLRLRSKIPAGQVFVDGERADPGPPWTLVLHKPVGLETTRAHQENTVYDCFPDRFVKRRPPLSPVGRLDRDTSGLLLFTDDGELLHRLTHPRHGVSKTYEVVTARPITEDQLERMGDGTMMLRGESKPLRPAQCTQTGPHTARVVLHEGRYHQVRRMFAAAGNHVEALHRSQVAQLTLEELPAGAWRPLSPAEDAALRQAVGLPT